MTELVQGSAEWLRVRLGKVTASRVADLMAKTKTGWGASRANYMAELVVERLTGAGAERFTNAAMAHGTACEPEAREFYAFTTEVEVDQVGFVPHPTIAMSGASPDGLIGTNGLVEIKCPNTATHLETLEVQSVPGKYLTQMTWQMACTGRTWCDFVSYDPRLPPHLRMFVKRVERDDAVVGEMEREVSAFLAELDDKLARLDALYGQPIRDAA